ncbi:MAG TPA: YkgJ family cysteine cluster protein [Candidatus Paceibacterota bacterium]|nr:YkgJ family cysteine cluster protein [Candidatus Paceibacterota bacterium]
MEIEIQKISETAKKKEAENKKFFTSLKKKHPKNLDNTVQQLHENIFEKINCLDCANCCKSISPILRDKDIERISKHLKIRPSDFTEKYLMIDHENDYVFRNQPCPFLLPDNYCIIYEVRPKACAEYPHTSQPNFINRLNLTIKNSFYCPAISEIIEELKKFY